MPLYGGGNKNKRKGTRRGLGNEQKAGVKGIAAQYITRNKAIKKLQVSLKDFRRLCILKGIYPRDPRKKKEGKDKTYYHVKDIAYLAHEPLLVKFRELKTFLKKYTKAQNRKDWSKARQLEEHKPQFTLAHLIKERYPTFHDALRDLDDPLSMVNLFALLPSSVTPGHNQHTPEKSFDCERLAAEFERFVVHAHALRKVFVSIKGIYYQARVQGADITWLVPHSFNQRTPDDVDYRVMVTFLQFYAELLRFTNLKLYHDLGLVYPPPLDQELYERRAGLKSVQVAPKAAAGVGAVKQEAPTPSEGADKKAAGKKGKVDASTKKALQKSVSAVLQKLEKAKPEAEDADMEVDDAADAAKDESMEDEFEALTGVSRAPQTAEEQDAFNAARVFKGMRFLLGREVAAHALTFVILCGGGEVESERDLSAEDARSSRFTHQVVDRPAVQGEVLPTREYVQPQWLFDSFNSYNAVPVAPYAPGSVPPPHLSPFVKEEEEDYLAALPDAARDTVYVPKQRAVLQSWGAKASWLRKKQAEFDEAELADAANSSAVAVAAQNRTPEEAEAAELAAEEARHARDLARERAGTSHSAHVEQVEAKKAQKAEAKRKRAEQEEEEEDEDEDEEDAEDAEDDDSEGEGDIVPDSEDEEEDDEEEEEEPTPAPISTRKRKAAAVDPNAPEELAKAMMPKKDKRLYTRMMYGIDKKKEAVQALEDKREQLEKQEQKKKKQKTATRSAKKK